MIPGIYVLRNKNNKKIYVGQSIVDVCKRSKHKSGPRNQLIDRAIKKHGHEMFERFIFYVPHYLLDDFERKMITSLNSLSPGGYNLESGGHGNKYCSQETRRKLSEAKLGEKNPMFGKPGTMLGKPSIFLGRHHSEEAKKKLGEAQKGRTHSDETKKKISEALRGRSFSEEHKNKLRVSHLRRAA